MKTKVLTYRAIIREDGKNFHGFVPALPGVHTSGKTIEETQKNLRLAISQHLEVMKSEKLEVPTENGIEYIESFTYNYV